MYFTHIHCKDKALQKELQQKKPVAKQKSTLKIQLPFGLDVISIVLKGLLSALSCCLLTSTLIDREQVVDEIEVQRRKEGKRQVPLYTHTHIHLWPLPAPALLSPLKVLRDSPSSLARSSSQRFYFSSLTLALMEMERIYYSGQG